MLRRTLGLLTLLVLFSGCRSGSFVGTRLNNFTAYYNKFYNAQNAFQAGVTALEKEDQPINRDLFLPVFPGAGQSASGPEFENAIKKGADVLRSHPNSKWVDDALLLIGKAYFYQQNYVGAEQKFREVMTLESALDDEARFWLARTLVASGKYGQAQQHLLESLAQEDRKARWEPMLRLELGELFVKQGQWEAAAGALLEGMDGIRDSDLAARAQFLLGQVYEASGNHAKAVAAFEQVQRYKPLYELAYAAQVSAIRIEGLHGDPGKALQELRRMERDDKNYSNRAELMLLRARIYQSEGHADEALALYDELLYGNDAGAAQLRGRIHYRRAELFRDRYRDFLLAAAHFDTAATALAQRLNPGRAAAEGGEQEAFTREAITDSREQAEVFKLFASVRGEISRMDSLLHLGSLDDAAFAEAVQQLRRQLAADALAQQRELDRRQAEQRFRGDAALAGSRVAGTATPSSSTQDVLSAGFLFHKDPIRVQEGKLSFIDRWGERPLVPNWRRLDAVDAFTSSGAGVVDGPDGAAGARNLQLLDDTLPQVDLSGVPRDPAAQRRMRADRAVARYELGNVLFLSMNRPDSAAAWYRLVIDEDGDQAVAQRAYYALAEVHRSLGDTLSARLLYEQILRTDPNSDFAGRVRERLGLAPVAEVLSDTLAQAEEAYAGAYRLWQDGRYAEALPRMLEVAAAYRATAVAPRALLAAGSIYAAWARRDSLDLFSGVPLALPDSLLQSAGLPVPAASVLPAAPASAGGAASAGGDSLRVAGPAAAAPEEAAVEAAVHHAPPVLHLDQLYTSIAEQYPASPYAERARLMLQALEEERPVPEAPAPDSTAAAPQAGPDAAAPEEPAAAAGQQPDVPPADAHLAPAGTPQPSTQDAAPAAPEKRLRERLRGEDQQGLPDQRPLPPKENAAGRTPPAKAGPPQPGEVGP